MIKNGATVTDKVIKCLENELVYENHHSVSSSKLPNLNSAEDFLRDVKLAQDQGIEYCDPHAKTIYVTPPDTEESTSLSGTVGGESFLWYI